MFYSRTARSPELLQNEASTGINVPKNWLKRLPPNQFVQQVYHEVLIQRQPPNRQPDALRVCEPDLGLPIIKPYLVPDRQYGLLTTVAPLHKLIADYRYPPHRGGNTEYLVLYRMQGKGSENRLLQQYEAVMRQRNVNRLVWNNGFTNDKEAHCNKESYQKACGKCHKKIWMTPISSGWEALDNDGKQHTCAKKKKSSKEPKHYVKECQFCGTKIVMMLMGAKKWVPFDENRTKHRCRNV